jgi:hypothetical protein
VLKERVVMTTNKQKKVKMIRGIEEIYSEELDILYSQPSFIKITKNIK